MRRVIVIVLAAIAISGGLYLYIFKKKELGEMADAATGYPAAKTAKEAIDLFAKAIKERNYKAAAKYCTTPYATELNKGADAAYDMGKSLDDLMSRMKDDQLITDELRYVLFYYDPFYKELTVALTADSANEATAGFKFEPFSGKETSEGWQVDQKIMRALSVNWPRPGGAVTLKVRKDGDAWKIDVPVSVAQQAATTRLTERYRDYSRAFEILSGEIKRDPTTKENVKKRLRELMEEAARNP